MKNIYLLPTDKPSRFSLNSSGKYHLTNQLHTNSPNFTNQNIYITSDKETKEGDYYYLPRTNSVHKCIEDPTELNLERRLGVAKIILTTDQDLIADGVEQISEDFLQWFIKNPSCEEVEVKSKDFSYDKEYWYTNYKIIIPKEEPKQETLAEIKKQEILNYLQICKSCGSKEVARCKWVNVNTEEIYSADSGTTLEWCFDCKSETNIINKEDYETRNT